MIIIPETLATILSMARPSKSKVQDEFIQKIKKFGGLNGCDSSIDSYGNLWLSNYKKEPKKRVAWSCHVDTMDSREGYKKLTIDSAGIIRLAKGKAGQCLGADDGAGIWLMTEMVKAGVLGDYIFHKDEEAGLLGATRFVEGNPDYLATLSAIIALDRGGTQEIITSQSGRRGCSDTFAESLATALSMTLQPSDRGVYTDTIEYFDYVPECTNVSVGYQSQHGPKESLDLNYLLKLRDALVKINTESLIIERVPRPESYYTTESDNSYMISAIERYPQIVAELLAQCGYDVDDIVHAASKEYSKLYHDYMEV